MHSMVSLYHLCEDICAGARENSERSWHNIQGLIQVSMIIDIGEGNFFKITDDLCN